MSVLDDTVALVDFDEVKNFLNMRGSDKDRDLVSLVNTISADCAGFCNRVFLSATYTSERYDGNGDSELMLKHYPITDVASLIPYDGATALIEDTEFVIYDADAGILKLLGGTVFPSSILDVKVTYTAGYVFASLPGDLTQSIMEGIGHRWHEQDKGRFGKDSTQMRDQNTTYIQDQYGRHVVAVWNRYRNRNVG